MWMPAPSLRALVERDHLPRPAEHVTARGHHQPVPDHPVAHVAQQPEREPLALVLVMPVMAPLRLAWPAADPAVLGAAVDLDVELVREIAGRVMRRALPGWPRLPALRAGVVGAVAGERDRHEVPRVFRVAAVEAQVLAVDGVVVVDGALAAAADAARFSHGTFSRVRMRQASSISTGRQFGLVPSHARCRSTSA
jgi:hypothetical protein